MGQNRAEREMCLCARYLDSVHFTENVTFLENIFLKFIFQENNDIFQCSVET